MKKNITKSCKQPNTKIELKIKSKNVTNNFILTPRTASALDQKQTIHKLDKFTQELRTDREKNQQNTAQKESRDPKRHQYRMVSTDHPKTTTRKRVQEDQLGTHTPLLKRMSYTSDMANKKKSTHSLNTLQKTKTKKKYPSKLFSSQSGQFNKSTLQRLIGVIIKDYKQGRLKQRQLEQTLMELYDRRKEKKSLGKKGKKKDMAFASFSNDFIRSTHRIKSEALVRKRKKSDEIYEGVIEGKSYVNKIIIKGITTSLFLKEEADFNLRENDTKIKNKSSYQINTSNSIKQLNEEMKQIKQQILQGGHSNEFVEIQVMMATRIQRAWRRYRTRKLLNNMAKMNNNNSRMQGEIFHILDQFTDQENDQPYNQKTFTRNLVRKTDFQHGEKQYNQLVQMISRSLNEKDISKEQCLRKILVFLNYPENTIKIQQKDSQTSKQQQHSVKSYLFNQSEEIVRSRVKILDKIEEEPGYKQNQNLVQMQSNEQMNSFTNKYSSKQVQQNNEFYVESQIIEQIDQSLTFSHSQVALNESFKTINIQSIQQGLKGRLESLQLRKYKQIQTLTQKLFLNNLTKEQYMKEKQKIEKWFRSQSKQLKKIKNSLMKSCNEAKIILESDLTLLQKDKSRKMLKCLSDKLIKKNDWSIRQNQQNHSKNNNRLNCQQDEYSILKKLRINEKDLDQPDLPQEQQFMSFNKKDVIQGEWQITNKCFQISPKLSRHTSLEQNDYRYEQFQKIIQEDDDLQDGLGKIEVKLQSEKYLQNKDDELEAEQISLINHLVNQPNKKLKYLCNEDKEDIFQFLFLDLVLEMFTQTYSGQTRILKTAQMYINKAKRLKKIPKGIKTNLHASKQYLKILSQYVINYKNGLRYLSFPMGPSAIQMLRYMRDQFIDADEEDNITSTLVLPIQIFEKVGKSSQLELKLERYYQDEEKEQSRLSFLRTALNINNKALFDGLNQMLDHQRPYGVWGKPFPWKKALSIDRKYSPKQQKARLNKSLQKTVESCSYLCGILVDKQDSLFGNHRVSEQYINQIREDRLSKMLANELIENEQRWIFYDDQQTQILMEISSFLTKKLIKELVMDMVSIRLKGV